MKLSNKWALLLVGEVSDNDVDVGESMTSWTALVLVVVRRLWKRLMWIS